MRTSGQVFIEKIPCAGLLEENILFKLSIGRYSIEKIPPTSFLVSFMSSGEIKLFIGLL